MGVDIEIGFDEDLAPGSEVGFSFGKMFKGAAKGLGSVAKGAVKASKSVVRSPLTKAGVGVLAVAFPAVGVPALAAVATANIALDKVEQGQAAAKTVNANLAKLKAKASRGDTKSAKAVNAMQVALATRKAVRAGQAPPRPVAVPGRGSFSITPRGGLPLTAASRSPASLYAPTPSPAALALKLAAGGSPLGRRMLEAVRAGKSVEVPSGVVVVPGKRPLRGKRVWIGKPPAGVRAMPVKGAHAVTKGGLVLSGQAVFVAA